MTCARLRHGAITLVDLTNARNRLACNQILAMKAVTVQSHERVFSSGSRAQYPFDARDGFTPQPDRVAVTVADVHTAVPS